MFSDDLESIALNESQSARHKLDIGDSLCNGLRIPSGQNTFAILSMFQNARAFSQNAAVRGAVFYDGLKSKLALGLWCLAQFGFCCFCGQCKSDDALGKPLGFSAQNGFPHGRDLAVEFHQQDFVRQIFKRGCQADDSAARERLDEQFGFGGQAKHPTAKERHEPGFASGGTERTALWHGSDVNWLIAFDNFQLRQ